MERYRPEHGTKFDKCYRCGFIMIAAMFEKGLKVCHIGKTYQLIMLELKKRTLASLGQISKIFQK